MRILILALLVVCLNFAESSIYQKFYVKHGSEYLVYNGELMLKPLFLVNLEDEFVYLDDEHLAVDFKGTKRYITRGGTKLVVSQHKPLDQILYENQRLFYYSSKISDTIYLRVEDGQILWYIGPNNIFEYIEALAWSLDTKSPVLFEHHITNMKLYKGLIRRSGEFPVTLYRLLSKYKNALKSDVIDALYSAIQIIAEEFETIQDLRNVGTTLSTLTSENLREHRDKKLLPLLKAIERLCEFLEKNKPKDDQPGTSIDEIQSSEAPVKSWLSMLLHLVI
jgi:hypothetical protein